MTIFEAIKSRDDEALTKIIAENPLSVNETENNAKPLAIAKYYGKESAIEILLKNGYKTDFFEDCMLGNHVQALQAINQDPGLINGFSADGFHALGLACFFGHAKLASHLLEEGADPNLPVLNPLKVTAIHAAAANGNIEIVQLLIAASVDVNAREASGFTALHTVAMENKPEIAAALIQAGASPDAQNDAGDTPRTLAQQAGHQEILAIFG